MKRLVIVGVAWLSVVFFATGSADDTAAFSKQVGGSIAGGVGTGIGSIPGWLTQFRANHQAASKGNTPKPPPEGSTPKPPPEGSTP